LLDLTDIDITQLSHGTHWSHNGCIYRRYNKVY